MQVAALGRKSLRDLVSKEVYPAIETYSRTRPQLNRQPPKLPIVETSLKNCAKAISMSVFKIMTKMLRPLTHSQQLT